MPCAITSARGIDCRDAIGGLKAIYFCSSYCSDILANATVTDDSYTITTAGFATWDIQSAGAVTVVKYDLVTDLSTFKSGVEADKATGSVMWNQTLDVVLHKIVAADLYELGQISKNRAQIFVQDSNDMNGLSLSFTAKEQAPLYILPASAGSATAKYPFDGLADEADLTITAA